MLRPRDLADLVRAARREVLADPAERLRRARGNILEARSLMLSSESPAVRAAGVAGKPLSDMWEALADETWRRGWRSDVLRKSGGDMDPEDRRLALAINLLSENVQAHEMAEWALCGYPRLSADEALAASLACTRVPPEVMDSYEWPWPSVLVEMPETLSRGFCDAMLLRTWGAEKDAAWDTSGRSYSVFLLRGSRVVATQAGGLAAMLRQQAEAIDGVGDMGMRFALGAVIEAGQYRPSPKRSYGSASARIPRELRGLPPMEHRHLTRRVSVDMREAVRAAASGGTPHGPPSVRSYVRGHWRNQRHGPGRGQVRRIHVEPYWRGPENAPTLSTLTILTTEGGRADAGDR